MTYDDEAFYGDEIYYGGEESFADKFIGNWHDAVCLSTPTGPNWVAEWMEVNAPSLLDIEVSEPVRMIVYLTSDMWIEIMRARQLRKSKRSSPGRSTVL